MSPKAQAGMSRVGSLDTLRGIAILLVVIFHVSIHYRLPDVLVEPVNVIGNQGVQLFYLVSAWTMCLLWREREGEQHRTIKFYIRRICRIAPLYWACIAFYSLYSLGRPSPGGSDILLNALLLHGFSPSAINSVVPGGWSIAVEVSFYLVFPLMAALKPNLLLAIGFAWFVALGIGAANVIEAAYGEGILGFIYMSMITQLPVFAIGMFLFARLSGDARASLGFAIAILVAWIAIAFLVEGFGLRGRPLFWVGIAGFVGLVTVVMRARIDVPLLSFFGRLSYSMYLFHFAVIGAITSLAGEALPFAAGFAIVLAATVAVALVSQRTAEKWSNDLGRQLVRLVDRRAARKRPVAAAAEQGW